MASSTFPTGNAILMHLVKEEKQKKKCHSFRTYLFRSIALNFKPKKGIHHHLPVLFDYFHLCAIEMTVHASLVSLHQPYITVPKVKN